MAVRLPLITLWLALGTPAVYAQHNPNQAPIMDAVQRLFTGMAKGDSAMVHSAFGPQVTLATVTRNKSGDLVLKREDSIKPFLQAVGTPHSQVWHEEIWNVSIQQDGDFVQVWCDYAFYLDNTFHHCGVNAFHLYKSKDGWKIFHLADTRRTENCQVPQDIKAKYQQ